MKSLDEIKNMETKEILIEIYKQLQDVKQSVSGLKQEVAQIQHEIRSLPR